MFTSYSAAMLRGMEHLLELLLTKKISDSRENTCNWQKEDLLQVFFVSMYIAESHPSELCSLSLGPPHSLLKLAPLTSHGNVPFRRRMRKSYTSLVWKLPAYLNEFMNSPPSAAPGKCSARLSQLEWGLFHILQVLKETPALPVICREPDQL